jgi:hypothetical protein
VGTRWLTLVAQELADRLGGVAALERSGAFAQVRQLRAGGVWLLATENFADYGMESAERVFRVLAPVVRPGNPERKCAVYEIPPYPVVLMNPADL